MDKKCTCGCTAKYKVETVISACISNMSACEKCAESALALATIPYRYGFTNELKTIYIVAIDDQVLTELQTEKVREYEHKCKLEVVEKTATPPPLTEVQKNARSPIVTEDEIKMNIVRNNASVKSKLPAPKPVNVAKINIPTAGNRSPFMTEDERKMAHLKQQHALRK